MAHRFQFGDVTFDPISGDLSVAGDTRRLEPQPARVLTMLLEASGQLVARETLRDALWSDTAVDFDQGINYCIRQIRAALGDEAGAPRFIETLPRRGYRFVLPVVAAGAPGASPASPPPRVNSVRDFVVALIVVLVAIGIFWLGPASRVEERRRLQELERDRAADTLNSPAGRAAGRISAPRPLRLAVLANAIPDDPEAAGRLDRLLEDLVAGLTDVGAERLGVVGPVTTGPLAGTERPHTEVGAQLGVDYVLSASVDDGDGVFAQLIAVPGGEHLFATRFPAGVEIAAMRETIQAGVIAAMEKASARPLLSDR